MGDFKILLKAVDPEHVENLRPILADLFSVDEGTAHDILSAVPLTLVDDLSIRGATIVKDRLKRLILLGAALVTTDDPCEDLPKINWPEPPDVVQVSDLDSPEAATSTWQGGAPAVNCPSCGEHLEVVLVPRGKPQQGASPQPAHASPRPALPAPTETTTVDMRELPASPARQEPPPEPPEAFSPVAEEPPAPVPPQPEQDLQQVFDAILDGSDGQRDMTTSDIAPGPIARLHMESGRLKARSEPELREDDAEPLHAEPVFEGMLDTSGIKNGELVSTPFRSEPSPSDNMLEAVFDDSDSLDPIEPVFEHDALSDPEIDSLLDDEDSFDLNALDDILDNDPTEIEPIDAVEAIDDSDDLIEDPQIFEDDSGDIDLDSLDRELAALDEVKRDDSPPEIESLKLPQRPTETKKSKSKRKRKRKRELQPLDPSEALAILHSSRASLEPVAKEGGPRDELDDLLAQAQIKRKKGKAEELSLPLPPEKKRKPRSPVFKKVDRVTRRIKSSRVKRAEPEAEEAPAAQGRTSSSRKKKSSRAVSNDESIHGLVLSKISSDAKKRKAASLIATIKNISEDEALKLTDRTIIPVLRGVSRDYAEECLGKFKVANISGRVTTRRS